MRVQGLAVGGSTESHLVAPGLFGFVHGRVTAFENLIMACVVRCEQGHANAGGAMVIKLVLALAVWMNAQLVRFGQAGADFFCNGLGLRDGCIYLVRQIIEDDDKLIATKARHRIQLSHTTFEPARHLP